MGALTKENYFFELWMAIWNPIGMLLSVAALNKGGYVFRGANVAYTCTKFEDALNYLTGEVK